MSRVVSPAPTVVPGWQVCGVAFHPCGVQRKGGVVVLVCGVVGSRGSARQRCRVGVGGVPAPSALAARRAVRLLRSIGDVHELKVG